MYDKRESPTACKSSRVSERIPSLLPLRGSTYLGDKFIGKFLNRIHVSKGLSACLRSGKIGDEKSTPL